MKPNPEIADAIRLETSKAPGFLEEVSEGIVLKVKQWTIRNYGKFIPKNRLEEIDGIEKRIIIAKDGNIFNDFYSKFHNNPLPVDNDVGGFYDSENKYMMVNPEWFTKQEFLKQPHILKRKEEIFLKHGEDISQNHLLIMALSSTLSHELLHAFQDYNNPRKFKECAVRWYQYQLVGGHTDRLLFGDNEAEMARIKYYQGLINQYGDAVHKLNFGQSGDTWKKIKLLRRIDKEYKQIP